MWTVSLKFKNSKLRVYLDTFRDLYFLTKRDQAWKKALSRWTKLSSKNAKDFILVQLVRDPAFLVKNLFLLKALTGDMAAGAKIGWVLTEPPSERPQSFLRAILNSLKSNRFAFRRILSLLSFSGGEVAGSTWIDWSDKNLESEANRIFESLKTKQELERLVWRNIEIGDLVYDTYLRYRPAPTVDLKDPYLKNLLLASLILVERFQRIFKERSPKIYVTSYSSYIHHGIPLRVALQSGCQVLATGAFNQLVVWPSSEFPYHKRNFHFYRKAFTRIEDQQSAIKTGREALQKRLSGAIDSATAFMKSSAYQSNGHAYALLPAKAKPRAIVMGHDFFDSPHIYGPMIFPDFWEWIRFVFKEAQNSQGEFYFKPHPNGLDENGSILDDLKKEFPHIHFLDSRWSNQNVVLEGFDVAFTVYGTVAHEFAYLGLPVVSAAQNPHAAYSFTKIAQSREDLADWVRNFPQRLWTPPKAEVEEFFFMHNRCFYEIGLNFFPMTLREGEGLDVFDSDKVSLRLQCMQTALSNGIEF